MQNNSYDNQYNNSGAGPLPKSFERLRRISTDVTTRLLFKMFIKQKQITDSENQSKKMNDNYGNGFDYYSRHNSIFEYTKMPQIVTQNVKKNEKKRIQRNSISVDLTALNQMKKMVYGSSKQTKHFVPNEPTVHPITKIQ